MTRVLPRTNFNSSRLIRFLADLAVVDATAPGGAFAEKLGLWLDFTDAIALSAVLNAPPARLPDAPSGGASVASPAAVAEFDRVRATQVDAITRSCSPQAGATRIKLPAPQAGVPIEIAADYEPYRRFYLAHQREMETQVQLLRGQVRDALAGAAPALRQLAALDAVLAEILSERESKLLSTVPTLLKKRFEHLRGTHLQRLADTLQSDDPTLWMQPGGWLAGFCQELHGVLLAELDLRLQPVVGLIEAFRSIQQPGKQA